MKKLLTLIAIAAFVGCGELETVRLSSDDGADGTNGVGCEIQGALLVCGDTVFNLDDLRGTDGKDGKDGADGQDGEDAVVLTIVDMPVFRGCYAVAPGLWAENEQNTKADLYNNSSCSHGPTPNEVLCDNLHSTSGGSGEVCAVDNYIFIVEGAFSEMQMYVLDFN